ncbi:MAG: elongation factor P [Tenericutes bacterium]|nr:elongation factor P [Bacilli bacterium]NLV90044.1 elongation factor P [Mycoplasmatota bacterium]
MINVNDFKTGMTIELDGEIFEVLEFSHVKPGKGAAFVKAKLYNLRTGSNTENSFNSSTKVPKALIEKKPMQFLYMNGNNYVFMNMDNYEQIEINETQINKEKNYLKENQDVFVIFYGDELLGINLPEKVELLITKSEPGVKGNTSSTAMKDAITETGLLVKVPLFVNEGEEIIVSTKDGKYVSRK